MKILIFVDLNDPFGSTQDIQTIVLVELFVKVEVLN